MARERAAAEGGAGGGGPVNDGIVDDGYGDGRMDAERLREMQKSIVASSSVFPGFRFSPTDEELISYYLKKKLQGSDKCVDIIPEVDFCRHEPWDLPGISIIYSENEWFFFSARGRKYPNGSQSRRATQSGYWKATGKERNVKSGAITIGTKRTLVFHTGRAPKGERTEWIMHEYCMNEATQDSLVVCRLRRNSDFRLNEASTRGSCDRRNLLTGDNTSKSGTNINTQIGVAKSVECCSNTSHSVEQMSSESDTDRKLVDDSPHASSSHKMDYENEDDCFADILKDDIIKLDESPFSQTIKTHEIVSMNPTHKLLHKSIPYHGFPVQGTAVRRIKLRQKPHSRHHRPPPHGGGNEDSGQNRPPHMPSSPCVFTELKDGAKYMARGHFRLLSLTLVLTFMVLFVACWMVF